MEANTVTVATHVSHSQHGLSLIARPGYSCDVCRGNDSRRYRCTQGCDFDVCGKCWDQGPLTLPPGYNSARSGVHASHAHEIKFNESLGYRCDLCSGCDTRRYTCKGCNWDCCGKCWDKGPVTTPQPVQTPSSSTNTLSSGIHSAHPHELKAHTPGGYSCDVCRGKDERRFHCSSGCNYDVCGKCWDKGPVTAPQSVQTPSYSTNTLSSGIHSAHAHELKSHTGGYSCDVCRGKDERRFHCSSGCNYDVCGKCWDKGPVTPSPQAAQPPSYPTNTLSSGIHSAHAHELKAHTPGGYSCDVCRGKDERRFHCSSGCNWDCCGKCWDKGPVTPVVVAAPAPSASSRSAATSGIHGSHAHPLKAQPAYGYSCDVCRSKDDRRFHCDSGCDYDVCGKCWDKGPVTPIPEPTPVAHTYPVAASISTPSSTGGEKEKEGGGDNSNVLIGIHGSHSHEMKFTGVGGYSCDICRGSDTRRYQCVLGCNYDVCGKCWDKGPVTVSPASVAAAKCASLPTRGRTPHHEHTCARRDRSEAFRCDVCRKSIGNGYPYHCMQRCNWDICEECWANSDVQVSTETEAPQLELKTAMLFMSMGMPVDEGSRALVESQPPGWKLHPNHPLANCPDRAKWSCDGCQIDGLDLLVRYQCTDDRCGYTLCNKCYTHGENVTRSSSSPVLIAPGPPEITGLPYRSEFDETQTKFWNEFRAPYAGTVVFSETPVERFFTPESLKKDFNLGSEINCRAVWPRALRNHPLGHKNGDPSTPVYGPTFILADAYGHMNIYALQVFVFVKVDGVQVGRALKWGSGKDEEVMTDALLRATEAGPKPPGSSSGFRNENAVNDYAKNFKPETVDFWAMNQSMTFGLVREKVNQSDDWERGMSTFMKHISGLSPGDHTVDVDLRFRLVGSDDTLISWSKLLPASEVWPNTFPTPMSHPIATGQFVLHVGTASVGGIQLTPDPFPKRNTKMDPAEATRMEALIADWMRNSGEWGRRGHQTERILKVVITGDWCKLEKQHQCKTHCKNPCPKYQREPWRWNLDFACVVYRSPTDGWPKEMPCRTFNLGAFAYNTTPNSKEDLIGIGVANSFEFDVDLVPDSAYVEAGIKRCPESLRGGFA